MNNIHHEGREITEEVRETADIVHNMMYSFHSALSCTKSEVSRCTTSYREKRLNVVGYRNPSSHPTEKEIL